MKTLILVVLLMLGCENRLRTGSGSESINNYQALDSDAVKIIAHRGNSSKFPENTLLAFEGALQSADLVELDYRMSADGIAVVMHDKTLDRTTTADEMLGRNNVRVSELNAVDIQSFDAGSWFSTQFYGEPVPLLNESIRTITTRRQVLIEHKDGDPSDLATLISHMEIADRVVVQSFNWEFLEEFKDLMPEVKIYALAPGIVPTPEIIARLKEIKADGVNWHRGALNTDTIATLKEAGLEVWAYTVAGEEMAALINAGVDGVVTNYPDAARRLLDESKFFAQAEVSN